MLVQALGTAFLREATNNNKIVDLDPRKCRVDDERFWRVGGLS